MITFVKDNCGFTDVSITTSEYAFGGLPTELAAGPAVFTVQNIGEEVHEVLVMRKNDGVTETAEEIIALPEEEAMAKATMAGVAFGFPGSTSFTTMDLAPGDYIAVCFLPQGATPELMAQMPEGPDGTMPPEAGPPHCHGRHGPGVHGRLTATRPRPSAMSGERPRAAHRSSRRPSFSSIDPSEPATSRR